MDSRLSLWERMLRLPCQRISTVNRRNLLSLHSWTRAEHLHTTCFGDCGLPQGSLDEGFPRIASVCSVVERSPDPN